MLLPLFVPARLMLLPVIVLWQMLCHLICYGILSWQMLLPGGLWNYHYLIIHG